MDAFPAPLIYSTISLVVTGGRKKGKHMAKERKKGRRENIGRLPDNDILFVPRFRQRSPLADHQHPKRERGGKRNYSKKGEREERRRHHRRSTISFSSSRTTRQHTSSRTRGGKRTKEKRPKKKGREGK